MLKDLLNYVFEVICLKKKKKSIKNVAVKQIGVMEMCNSLLLSTKNRQSHMIYIVFNKMIVGK